MVDVKGYTPLIDEQKERANTVKEAEERFLRIVEDLQKNEHTDKRCLAIAIGKIQEASMWTVRGIFKPARIMLDEDM